MENIYFLIKNTKKKNSFQLNKNNKKKILIAPTWGTDFFESNIHIKIKKNLDPNKFEIFIRPHKMSIVKNNNLINNLIRDKFIIHDGDLDFNYFDLLITDWSGIYIEFAKINKIKSILIQNKEKILNKEYSNFEDQSIDELARKELGKTITISEITSIENDIKDIISNQTKHIEEINNFFKNNFY